MPKNSKNNIFAIQQINIKNKLLDILNITSENNYFLLYTLVNNIEKQQQVIALENECKEFFATSRWVYFFNKKENKESERPYLNLIRNILQATKIEFFNKPCSFTLDNVKHTSVKYFIVL